MHARRVYIAVWHLIKTASPVGAIKQVGFFREKIMKVSLLRIFILPFVVLVLGAGPALAQEEGAIKYRKAVMKAVGGHMGAMAGIVKGKVKGSQKEMEALSHAMRELASITPLIFPEGSDFGETRALEVIWQKPKEFKKVLDAFLAEATKLAEISHSGDKQAFGAQFKAMGKNACGACHKNFREKKKK
jgi:cytochrome c556